MAARNIVISPIRKRVAIIDPIKYEVIKEPWNGESTIH